MGRALMLFVIVVGFSVSLLAQIPAIPPKPNQLVNEYAGVLAPGNRQQLERKLVAYDDSTSTQIAIVIERMLDGNEIFDRSYAIAKAWGVGGDNDNGVLIYVAIDNRQIFIQNGYGVEDRLTDALTRRIIDKIIVPEFRSGSYYQGLDKATNVMIDLLAGRYQAPPEGGDEIPAIVVLLIFLFAFFLLSWLLSRGGGSNDDDDGGYYRGGRYQGPRRRGGWVVVPGGGGFGGGGFGGGGGGFGGGGFGGGSGGFGGFGGGSFGGGGAGGSW